MPYARMRGASMPLHALEDRTMKKTKTEYRYQVENREYVIRVYRSFGAINKVTTSWHRLNFFDAFPPAGEEFNQAVSAIVNDWLDRVCK